LFPIEHVLHSAVAHSVLKLKDVAGRKRTRIGKRALNCDVGKSGRWRCRDMRLGRFQWSLRDGFPLWHIVLTP
jgi:hypothetical protein